MISTLNNTMSIIAIPKWAMGHSLYIGGVLGPDNKMYFVPKHANHIAVLDTNTQSLSSFTTEELLTPSIHRFCTALLIDNGRIYFIPDTFSCSMVLTPSAGNSVSFIGLIILSRPECCWQMEALSVFPKFSPMTFTPLARPHTPTRNYLSLCPTKPTSLPQNMQEACCCQTVTL